MTLILDGLKALYARHPGLTSFVGSLVVFKIIFGLLPDPFDTPFLLLSILGPAIYLWIRLMRAEHAAERVDRAWWSRKAEGS